MAEPGAPLCTRTGGAPAQRCYTRASGFHHEYDEHKRRMPMREYLKFYINGEWVDPVEAKPWT
jgi:hypothetical protein